MALSLVNGIAMLHQAQSDGYAIGAFDLINLEFLEATLAAAAVCRAPVILSLAEMHLKDVDLEVFAPTLLQAARRAPVPVSVHLDHGERLETIERALAAGFTSVMIDGSTLPYDQNVRLTREAVRMAHAVGAAVEAELGYVAGREFYADGSDGTGAVGRDRPAVYTDPDQAADFVEKTGCDFLAVSVGTIHGSAVREVRLDIPRLQRLHRDLPVPLVLHGGSGLMDGQFRQLIAGGISKINFYSELSQAAIRAIRDTFSSERPVSSIMQILGGMKEAVFQVVAEKIALWGGSDRA